MKGYRTIVFNVCSAIVEIAGVVPPKYQPYALVAVAVCNIALRFVTDTPVGIGITKVFGFVAPLVLVAGLGLSGCAAQQQGASSQTYARDLETRCLMAQMAYSAGFRPLLIQKCLQAKDPLKDKNCLTDASIVTALSICMLSAQRGDEDAVKDALMSAAQQAPYSVVPPSDPSAAPSASTSPSTR
jgi:hypothetical protein